MFIILNFIKYEKEIFLQLDNIFEKLKYSISKRSKSVTEFFFPNKN